MIDEEARPQGSTDVWLRAGLAGAFLFLYLSILIACFILPFHRNKAVFEQLGMTELPWLTGAFLRFFDAVTKWWWAIGALFLLLSILAWKDRLGRRGWRSVVVVFAIGALLPVLFYFAMEMPLVEIRKKLHVENHGAG